MACNLTASISLLYATDNGDGTFTASFQCNASGGTGIYSYLWGFAPPAGVDGLALNCPTGQTTQTVTLTLPLAPYASAGLNPLSGQPPPDWLNATCTVTDSQYVDPPELTFRPDRLTAGQGDTVNFTYTSTGASAVTLDGAAVALNGSQSSVPFP